MLCHRRSAHAPTQASAVTPCAARSIARRAALSACIRLKSGRPTLAWVIWELFLR